MECHLFRIRSDGNKCQHPWLRAESEETSLRRRSLQVGMSPWCCGREAGGFPASAPLKASHSSRSTRPHKSWVSLRSYNETALPARATPDDDHRSPAKSRSHFDGVTTRDSGRRQCGKPGRDPRRITTWLAGQGRSSPPSSRGGNSANVRHRSSSPTGLAVPLGSSLAKVLSTLS